jgi:hypothetical protein
VWWKHAQAVIGVVNQVFYSVESLWIAAGEWRKDYRPMKGDTHLPTVRVAGELEIDAAVLDGDIGEVRLVDKQYRRPLVWKIRGELLQEWPMCPDWSWRPHVFRP